MNEIKKVDIWDKMSNFRVQKFGKWPIVSAMLQVFQIALYVLWLILRRIAPGLFQVFLTGALVIPGFIGFLLYCFLIFTLFIAGLRLFLGLCGMGHI